MQLNLSYEDGYVLAATDGPIDGSAGELFRQSLHPLVRQPETRLIVELSRSPLINSDGIGHLIKLVADANTHGSRVVLAGPTPFVAKVLEVTRLNRFFDLQPSLSLAIEAVLRK
jgi:anti-sigma B factor antagonist